MGIEIDILNWIQNWRTPLGDSIFAVITSLGNAGIIWIILTAVLLLRKETRRPGLIMLAALVIDVLLCNLLLKNLVARTRPFDVNPNVVLAIKKPLDYSFPSGHTAASFASVAALYLSKQKWLWKAAVVLAILIAFSRLYFYVHFPTDIIGGMIVGVFSGWLGFWIVKQTEVRFMHSK